MHPLDNQPDDVAAANPPPWPMRFSGAVNDLRYAANCSAISVFVANMFLIMVRDANQFADRIARAWLISCGLMALAWLFTAWVPPRFSRPLVFAYVFNLMTFFLGLLTPAVNSVRE